MHCSATSAVQHRLPVQVFWEHAPTAESFSSSCSTARSWSKLNLPEVDSSQRRNSSSRRWESAASCRSMSVITGWLALARRYFLATTAAILSRRGAPAHPSD